jgi:hypothetical protein
MPTDTAVRTVVVEAPLAPVLATIREVGKQSEWIKEISESEVLETDDDGAPLTARFAASTAVGTDRYTLSYEHLDDGLRWHLVEGRLQTGQNGHYSVRAVDDASTEVTYELTISHNLPLPGFIRRRTIEGLVKSTLDGLTTRVEAP